MPIRCITGKPRNGKTLRMVYELQQQAKKANRPIFAAGIDGLQPGLATPLPDPTRWNDKDANGEFIVPDGSIIFVDEAWKWFGHLSDARGQKTPQHVLDMAEHGHRALDFVFTTQGPGQLYPFMRPLMADHLHCVRIMGMQACTIYEWPELQDDPKSAGARSMALKTTWPYPKDLYSAYTSASGHENIKPKIPKRVFALPLLLFGALGLGWFAMQSLKPEAMAATVTGKEPEAAQAAPAPGARGASTASHLSHLTGTAYAEALAPRIQRAPWVAPAFEGREVVAKPEVYCMTSQPGQDAQGNWREATYTCITEQGTRYKMDRVEAEKQASEGPMYNPYREPTQGHASLSSGGGGRAPTERAGAAAPAVVGIGDAGTLQAAYGGFRGDQ